MPDQQWRVREDVVVGTRWFAHPPVFPEETSMVRGHDHHRIIPCVEFVQLVALFCSLTECVHGDAIDESVDRCSGKIQ